MIISYILMTLMVDSRVILLGEIKCLSLLEVKGFIELKMTAFQNLPCLLTDLYQFVADNNHLYVFTNPPI